MTNIEKYEKVFINCFSVDKSQLDEKFEYESVTDWDSIGHMGMITELEDTFDIMMDTDDIIDFSSYDRGKEILKKYNVEI